MNSRIQVVADAALDARGHTAVDLEVTTRDGSVHQRALDIAPGFPGADLTDAEHQARFRECMAYAPKPLSEETIEKLLAALGDLPGLVDVRVLLQWLGLGGLQDGLGAGHTQSFGREVRVEQDCRVDGQCKLSDNNIYCRILYI